MRRWGWLLPVLAAGTVVLAAMASAGPGPKVVVTIKPIHSLVTRLMQGVGTPALIVEGAASPHTFALKPSGARAIGAAEVFIRVAPSVEPFTEKIIRTLPESVRVVTLIDAPGVRLLPLRDSGTFEEHDHRAEGEEDAAPRYGDAPRRGNVDGHIWLDPDNAKAIVAHLAEVLSVRAPEHADRIKANARELEAELDALTAELEAETAPLRDKPFILFHDASQYFERRFGLDAAGAITVSPEVPPGARRISELRAKIRSFDAMCVFAEPSFQPNLVAALTESTGARAGTLDAEGASLEPGAGLYFALLRNLAGALSSCLKQAS
jgi:zinc transport system substrate-binding protein